MTFGLIMFGEDRRAKIRCKCKGVEKPKVSIAGDTVNKMRCASEILAELAREELPEDEEAQIDMIRYLAGFAIKEITQEKGRKKVNSRGTDR